MSRSVPGDDRFKYFVTNTLYGYFEHDIDGKITCANENICRMSGYSEQELIGAKFGTFLEDEEKKKVDNDLERKEAGSRPSRTYYTFRAKDGTMKDIEVISLPLKEGGKTKGFFGTVRDITSERRMEKQLQESEDKYRSIFENITDVYYRSDMDGNVVLVSPSGKDLLGYSTAEELIGKNIADTFYYNPEDRETFVAELRKTGQVKNYEVILRHRNGFPVYVETNSHFLYDNEGNVSGIEGMIRDVTEHKKADEALKESEQKYRRLFEHSNDAIFISCLDGTITDVNRSACTMLGYTYDELMDMRVFELHPEEELETSRQALEQIQTTHMVRFDSRLQRRDGSLIDVEISARVIDDDNGIIEGIVHDISRRKQGEQERRELEARLHRARKMEALGALASGVAHDLNNILWGLVSYPDVILTDLPEGDPLREHVIMIQRSGEKAVSIVQDLLALARRGVTATEVLNINDVIRDYLESPEYLDIKGQHHEIQWNIMYERKLSNIVGSPLNIRKTVMNLVINAIEAMKGGGTISVSTSGVTVDEQIRGYEEIPAGKYAVITVSDEGEGISSENMERIFEPFFTTKVMERSGTGLGMAVVWGTVKDHNGFIDVESGDEAGTRFSLYFPVTHKEKGAGGHESEQELEQLKGNGETILVVDDLPEQRELLSLMLSQLGYSPETAESGEQAVEFMKNNTADLLIIDMFMNPGMSGLDTFREIRKIHPNQKAVIGSGMNETEEVQEAHDLGIRTCLSKPYRLKTLGGALRDELSRG